MHAPHQISCAAVSVFQCLQAIAMWALVMFYHELWADLQPLVPLGKFIVVKGVVFMSFWQVSGDVCRAMSIATPMSPWRRGSLQAAHTCLLPRCLNATAGDHRSMSSPPWPPSRAHMLLLLLSSSSPLVSAVTGCC